MSGHPRASDRLDLRRWAVLVRAEVRQGVRRVRGSALPILTAAAGASIAWLLAESLGHDNPIFAPIAAWICLGFKVDRVPRKVAELGVGATVGVLIGEWASQVLAAGWWQVGLVLTVSALFGRLIDRGELTTMQAGVNGVVILGMSWWEALVGGIQGRWVEALLGAGVAFVIAVLLPRHPSSRPRRYAVSTLLALADVLEPLGQGLTRGDIELLVDARAKRRALTQVATDFEQTLATAREVVALNPGLWRHRGEIAELERVFRLLRRARRTLAMLERQALSMTEEVGPMPTIGEQVLDASRATFALAGSVRAWVPPVHARRILVAVAARAAPSELPEGDWRPVALMSIVRALVVDLLQVSGLDRDRAREHLADSAGRPFADPDEVDLADDGDDGPSPTWG